jgi:hypothetical protein
MRCTADAVVDARLLLMTDARRMFGDMTREGWRRRTGTMAASTGARIGWNEDHH